MLLFYRPLVFLCSISTFVCLGARRGLSSLVVLSIGLFFAHSATAQSEAIINRVTLHIAEGKYNDAERYLDSILHIEPRNIDALMMKGNLLLNYALMQKSEPDIITTADESIYSDTLATAANPIYILPRLTATKIEKLWLQCLVIDSTRLDLMQGLSTVYAMALLPKELLAMLPTMSHTATAAGKGDKFAYTLMSYAIQLLYREDSIGYMTIYHKTTQLYPNTKDTLDWWVKSYYEESHRIPKAKSPAEKAYTQFMNHDYLHSLKLWQQVATEKDPKTFAPAHYFMARCYTLLNDTTQAIAQYKLIEQSKDESKYAYLAMLRMKKLTIH